MIQTKIMKEHLSCSYLYDLEVALKCPMDITFKFFKWISLILCVVCLAADVRTFCTR